MIGLYLFTHEVCIISENEHLNEVSDRCQRMGYLGFGYIAGKIVNEFC